MTLDSIKKEAAIAANEIQLNWESLDNPKYRKDFEMILERAEQFVPELEVLYAKLTSGKSVMLPDEDTSLSFEDVEKYSSLITEELFNGYVLQELYHKYKMVNAIIDADKSNPEGLDKGDPNQLNLFHD
jgi:hypothetical protein